MKTYLALALLLPGIAFGQNLDRWNSTNNVIRAANNYGPVLCNSAVAVSYTIPDGARYVRFDPTMNGMAVASCMENTAQPVCGTAYPTASTATSAWEVNTTVRRIVEVNNGASLRPNRLWVQPASASGCVGWHYNAPMTNE